METVLSPDFTAVKKSEKINNSGLKLALSEAINDQPSRNRIVNEIGNNIRDWSEEDKLSFQKILGKRESEMKQGLTELTHFPNRNEKILLGIEKVVSGDSEKVAEGLCDIYEELGKNLGIEKDVYVKDLLDTAHSVLAYREFLPRRLGSRLQIDVHKKTNVPAWLTNSRRAYLDELEKRIKEIAPQYLKNIQKVAIPPIKVVEIDRANIVREGPDIKLNLIQKLESALHNFINSKNYKNKQKNNKVEHENNLERK